MFLIINIAVKAVILLVNIFNCYDKYIYDFADCSFNSYDLCYL